MRLILIGATAFAASLVSGLLGLGGAVLVIPAYLYLPDLFGVTPRVLLRGQPAAGLQADGLAIRAEFSPWKGHRGGW
jgi:uncharacterized membrane protein YfcA